MKMPLLLLSLIPSAVVAQSTAVFTKDQTLCFGRNYDAAHLAANPMQSVKAIHLWDAGKLRTGLEQVVTPDALRELNDDNSVRLQLYVERKDGALFSGAVHCNDQLHCHAAESNALQVTQITLQKTGQQLMLSVQQGRLPVFRMNDHLSLVNLSQEAMLDAAKDDRQFRLSALTPSDCQSLEARFSGAHIGTVSPVLSSILKSKKICLAGQQTDTDLRLSLDTSRSDWPEGPQQVRYRVLQKRGKQAIVGNLNCEARDYAWRCELNQDDEDRSHPLNQNTTNINFRPQTGLMLRHPKGAVLRSLPCLSDCQSKADILLHWRAAEHCTLLTY